MTTAYALQCLDSVRARDDVVVEEAPGARGVMQANLPMPGADSFYTMASGGLGWGLPAAVGVALGRQKLGLKGRTIALIGDGSAMYAIQALHAAAQTQAPVTFIILNNARYAALQDFAPVFGYGAQEKPVGTDLAGLDFVALAKGHGLAARRVETAAALPAALRAGLRKKEPNLIDIMVT
jgi:benzoylformate decarboxylase